MQLGCYNEHIFREDQDALRRLSLTA